MPDEVEGRRLLWKPDADLINESRMVDFFAWLQREKGLGFQTYEEAWQWSIDHLEEFWQAVSDYFSVIYHTPPEKIMSEDSMPDVSWFEGSTLNYAEHIFRNATDQYPAILFQSERHSLEEISWSALRQKVASLAAYLQAQGVKQGDRVVAFLPNIPEATVGFLAANALGAVWSSCSPDFGLSSIVDRFQQIKPKVLLAVDGYQYGGKSFDKIDVVAQLREELSTLEKVIVLPYLNEERTSLTIPDAVLWETTQQNLEAELTFTPVPFSHPIWVLYSSGTTGIPKAITHSHGGVLLEHLKYLAFHNDVQPGERFFWFSTTGWMMWNFVQAALLVEATIVLYDGSPGYPDLNVLWALTEEAGIHHFGTSAPFLVATMKKELQPGEAFNLSRLRSIGSTGAPLPPEAFDYVYEYIKPDVWLCSMSGGTDVCTAFVGGCPLLPLYEGEIQSRALGCALYAYNDQGQPIENEVGEMVITQPMPSMPIYFWNDPHKERYRESYFDEFPGVWRHGDWVEVTDRGSLVIYGRSDATLNRQGIRIGTAEIYRSINKIPEIKDSLIVNLELEGGRHYMPLFVKLAEGQTLSDDLIQKVKKQLRNDYSPRHVPDELIEVPDIPYTISGKKLEAPVKKILLGRPPGKAANKDAMRNPDSLQFFIEMAEGLESRD